MSKLIGFPKIPKQSDVIQKGKPIKEPKPKFPKPSIKPEKIAMVKPEKVTLPKLKTPTVNVFKTTKAKVR